MHYYVGFEFPDNLILTVTLIPYSCWLSENLQCKLIMALLMTYLNYNMQNFHKKGNNHLESDYSRV